MQLTEENITAVKLGFKEMENIEDLLNLINYVKPIIFGEKSYPIKKQQLYWYCNINLNKKRYKQFKIKKKSGAERTIHAPVNGLKIIQKCLASILSCVFEPHQASMGFIAGRSIVDNATIHIGSNYVYNIDLKDFFPSVDKRRVFECLKLRPFKLLGARQELANTIALLCCAEMEVERFDKEKNEWATIKMLVLPQGAPTSPLLTNVVCQRLDYLLTAVANRFGLRYTRYADDITFSSQHNVYTKDSELKNDRGLNFIDELERIVAEQRFVIKDSKTRLQKNGYRKEVTGLLVNERVNVQKRYIKQLRMWLYLWERYGYDKASSIFLKDYTNTSIKKNNDGIRNNNERLDRWNVKQVRDGKPAKRMAEMGNVIAGKLDYLKMVKGECAMYSNLRKRLHTLQEKHMATSNAALKQLPLSSMLPKYKKQESDLEKILDNILKDGYEVAMTKYKPDLKNG